MYLEAFVQYFIQLAMRKNVPGQQVRAWALRRALATLQTWANRIEAELEKL